ARLTQVVTNLLNNAAKYTDEGGRIWLTVEEADGSNEPSSPAAGVVIRVRDNGIGIPPDMLSLVFELFTQLDSSLERSQGGLGVGLTLVRRLVEMHGGRVEVRSDGLGQGSEFAVWLPTATAGAPNGVAGPGSAGSAQPPRLKIVVADDNE